MSDIYYLDSSVLLAWLKDEQGRVDNVGVLFEEAWHKEIKIFTSALTIAEVLNIQGGYSPISKDHKLQVRKLFAHPWLSIISVTRRIAETSQDMVWDHRIKPKDGIHVASAIIQRATKLYSYDAGLTKHANLHTTHGAIHISEPPAPTQSLLPLS